mmetsp:Transcript_4988/g.12657  ORF Transcript_4988/g.12657 Transcript_4988/m.12657 type:complete len:322 (-) Transcript_4988:389-1354(-)
MSSSTPSPLKWWLGLGVASFFSLAYVLAPIWIVLSVVVLIFQWPSLPVAVAIASPVILSAILPRWEAPSWVFQTFLSPMLDYFDYEEIIETKPVNIRKNIRENKKPYMIALQPHGILSYVSFCSTINFEGKLPATGAADAVLATPLIRHVIGIFPLVSASKSSLMKKLTNERNECIDRSVIIYVGGIAELFVSSPLQETLYLAKRKGFIKLALQSGVDVVPVYCFGNTTCLENLKTGFLVTLSRKLQISLTVFWGKWGLPIPRDVKLMYVSGQPLGMPKISDPSQDDIDKWHSKYCAEVKRLFDSYKERIPDYKHKELVIV